MSTATSNIDLSLRRIRKSDEINNRPKMMEGTLLRAQDAENSVRFKQGGCYALRQT